MRNSVVDTPFVVLPSTG